MAEARKRITVAILAMGGQGGGVLSDWIVEMGRENGWLVQATSVPGVAQRTGSTVYYLEMFPEGAPSDEQPMLALSPTPGDVDVVVAAELMEAGRAMLRGFVSARTVLIASTHRVYAIAEKTALADGRRNAPLVLETAQTRAGRLVAFDMEAAAASSGAVISAIMFGALCGSGALPFDQAQFEAAIVHGGVAVERNIKGFREGLSRAAAGEIPAIADKKAPLVAPTPTTEAGRALAARVEHELPDEAHALALEGVRRLMDYQDARYANLYLDRLASLAAAAGEGADPVLLAEAARHLALWMSYEDTIRVAELKTRASRIDRVRGEVRAGGKELLSVTEYMHPRVQEVCDTLPAGLGRAILANPGLSRWLEKRLGHGRHVTTTGLGWFLVLRFLAGLRPWRPASLRYQEEQARIEDWLGLAGRAARRDGAAALELIKCQKLVRGYGDTHARGLASYGRVTEAYRRLGERADAAAVVRTLREAALADDQGLALDAALAQVETDAAAATSPPALALAR